MGGWLKTIMFLLTKQPVIGNIILQIIQSFVTSPLVGHCVTLTQSQASFMFGCTLFGKV